MRLPSDLRGNWRGEHPCLLKFASPIWVSWRSLPATHRHLIFRLTGALWFQHITWQFVDSTNLLPPLSDAQDGETSQALPSAVRFIFISAAAAGGAAAAPAGAPGRPAGHHPGTRLPRLRVLLQGQREQRHHLRAPGQILRRTQRLRRWQGWAQTLLRWVNAASCRPPLCWRGLANSTVNDRRSELRLKHLKL